MDHAEALQQKATERYLLDELDPEVKDQFEEHLFDCQECALDVRAAAVFVEQSKIALGESQAASVRVPAPVPAKPSWLASLFRPALAVPVLAMLLAVVGYQRLVTVPHLTAQLSEPQLGPYVALNISTRGSVKNAVTVTPDEGFHLLVTIPPDMSYSAYILELHNPAGQLKWSRKIPASSPDDLRTIFIPGAGLEQGTYVLTVNGVTAAGQSSSLGNHPIELQVKK
jgi:anti-sigma factor RsiW